MDSSSRVLQSICSKTCMSDVLCGSHNLLPCAFHSQLITSPWAIIGARSPFLELPTELGDIGWLIRRVYRYDAFYNMTGTWVHRTCRYKLVDVGDRALTLGLFFFLVNSGKRADSMVSRVAAHTVLWKNFLQSPSGPPAWRPPPPIHH